MARVLIVCEDGELRNECANMVVSMGHSCAELSSIEQAVKFEPARFEVVIAEEGLHRGLLDERSSWESRMIVLVNGESTMDADRFRHATAISSPFLENLPAAVAAVIATTLSTVSE